MSGKKLKWRDSSGYTQSKPRGTVPPSIWELEGCEVRVSVHRHIHNPGVWHVTCREAGLALRELKSEDVDDAKDEALILVGRAYNHLVEKFAPIIAYCHEDRATRKIRDLKA